MEDLVAQVSNEFLDYQYDVLGVREFMASPDVTEICINRPGELYLESRGAWRRIEVPSLTFERARQFCTAVVNESNTGQRITDTDPVVSLTFPTGQRAQFVIPPACEAHHVSITIRLPSRQMKTLEQYQQDGFFDEILEVGHGISEPDRELLELRAARRYADFFKKAVLNKKNIVVSGATGSGKTTFMKSLVHHIPADERLVTIEDARELFIDQPNVVHLLYSKGGQSAANVTAKSCMEACLRMKPDRIILAELRGDESFYFIRNCASGHPGSITSCHSGSTEQTWDQLALSAQYVAHQAVQGVHAVEHGAQRAAHAVEHTAQTVAHTVHDDVAKGVHATEHAVSRGVHAVEHGAQYVAHETALGARAVEHGVQHAAQSVEHQAANVAHAVRDHVSQGIHATERAASQGLHAAEHAAQVFAGDASRAFETLRHPGSWFDDKPAASAPVRLDHVAHPDHALYQQTRHAVHRLDAEHHRAPDQHSDNLAAALTVAARRDGLSEVHHVVLSDDASRAFALQGELNPFEQITHVETAKATHTPIEQSSAAWQQIMQQKQQDPVHAPQMTQEPRPQQPQHPVAGM